MSIIEILKGDRLRSATAIMDDPKTSPWLRDALRGALIRDPIDAANDAEVLRTILFQRAADAYQDDASDPNPSPRNGRRAGA